MVRRAKATSTKTRQKGRSSHPRKAVSWERLVKLYPSLGQGPKPAERLARFLQETAGPGCGPMTQQELEHHLEEFKDLWPDEEIDAFLDWLYETRGISRSS